MSSRDSYIFFDQDTAFQGEVSTDHLVLEGVITGEVLAAKDVFLKQGSLVQGEISTQKYTIEEGSIHQGKLRMDMKRNGAQDKNGQVSQNGKVVGREISEKDTSRSAKNGTSTSEAYTYGSTGTGTSGSGFNGRIHQPSADHENKPSDNGHGKHSTSEREGQTVFDRVNKVSESTPDTDKETKSSSSQNDYKEPPPQERLW